MPALPRSRFTFAQLRALEAVARNASFTRAAEELHLAQPTISIQVKELGDCFGAPLLDVSGRRVRPTQAGAKVLATARRVFDEFANLDMGLAELQGLRRGRLRIAAVTKVLDVRGFPIRRCWYIVRPAERALTPVARAFLEFVRDRAERRRRDRREGGGRGSLTGHPGARSSLPRARRACSSPRPRRLFAALRERFLAAPQSLN